MDSVDSMDTSIQPYTVYGFAYSQNEMVDLQNRKPFSIAEYRLSILSILSTTTTTPFLSSTERLEAGVWTVGWTVGGQVWQVSTVHCARRARSWRVGVWLTVDSTPWREPVECLLDGGAEISTP